MSYDNLFEVKHKINPQNRKMVQKKKNEIKKKNKIEKSEKIQKKEKSRKLALNWFDSSEETIKTKDHQDNVKKLMDLLKLANQFKDDPNFDVKVHIHYKNDNDGERHSEHFEGDKAIKI